MSLPVEINRTTHMRYNYYMWSYIVAKYVGQN